MGRVSDGPFIEKTNEEFRSRFCDGGFPWKLEPFEDELLSSYLVRLAYSHHFNPATFYRAYFPDLKKIFFDRDIDLWLDNEALCRIADKAKILPEKLMNLSLRSYTGYLFETPSLRTKTAFIDPVAIEGTVSRRGYKFCPECLKRDGVPYFRKLWRVSFYTVCPGHRTLLTDRCPQCNTPVSIHKHARLEVFPHCYRCGFKLKDTPPRKLPDGSEGIKAIKFFTGILNRGYMKLNGGRYAYSLSVFSAVRILIRITLRLWREGKGEDMFSHDSFARIEDPGKHLSQIKKMSHFENAPVEAKYFLFSAVFRILCRYPDSLKEFIEGHRIPFYMFTKDLGEKNLPFFLWDVVKEYKSPSLNAMTPEELRSAMLVLVRRGIEPTLKNLKKYLSLSIHFGGAQVGLKTQYQRYINNMKNTKLPLLYLHHLTDNRNCCLCL